jgi:2-amino-4-hydroxy-6-hydroxymethyldihydropteridine diphosphokinase
MNSAHIGLGSNLDDPPQHIEKAIEMLADLADTEVEARSSMYRSAPFGPVEQPDFVNAAVTLATSYGARELLAQLKNIEHDIGREPAVRWGPRTIDLDLLVYGDLVIDEPGLIVPHPGIPERNFVLLPLREIAPELLIPGLGRLADIAVNESEPQISRIA